MLLLLHPLHPLHLLQLEKVNRSGNTPYTASSPVNFFVRGEDLCGSAKQVTYTVLTSFASFTKEDSIKAPPFVTKLK